KRALTAVADRAAALVRMGVPEAEIVAEFVDEQRRRERSVVPSAARGRCRDADDAKRAEITVRSGRDQVADMVERRQTDASGRGCGVRGIGDCISITACRRWDLKPIEYLAVERAFTERRLGIERRRGT